MRLNPQNKLSMGGEPNRQIEDTEPIHRSGRQTGNNPGGLISHIMRPRAEVVGVMGFDIGVCVMDLVMPHVPERRRQQEHYKGNAHQEILPEPRSKNRAVTRFMAEKEQARVQKSAKEG